MKKIVGIAACPTGIAHTYMVADAIELAAKELGYLGKVETQGSIGIENRLSEQEIQDADLIIISVGVAVRDWERFEGYEDKTIHVPLQKAIEHSKGIIQEYFEKGGK